MPLVLLLLAAAPIVAPPAKVRDAFRLSERYVKSLDAGGVPVLGSERAADAALREARFIMTSMLVNHPEYFTVLAASKIRLVVMAPSELTTDVAEHADLSPKEHWDRRARGLGATLARPAVSCAEENLLEEPGDPYRGESICLHELAHTVAELAIEEQRPGFEERIRAAYEAARARGTWQRTYAMTNVHEYWAEAVQSWFDTNLHDDGQHGPIDTREEVMAADPAIAALIVEALGDVKWRYVPPSRRPAAERLELLGALPDPLPRFAWPDALREKPAAVTLGPVPAVLPASPGGEREAVMLIFTNASATAFDVDWVDFGGALKRYSTVAPGTSLEQPTYAGHVWLVSRGKRRLGVLAAPKGRAQLTVR